MKRTTTRRRMATVAGLGGALALSVGLAAPAAHAATAPGTGPVPITCKLTTNFVTKTYHWTADISTNAPGSVAKNTFIAPPTVKAKITTDVAFANDVRSLGLILHPTSFLAGLGNTLPYKTAGSALLPGLRVAPVLAIPSTSIPASGPIVVNATGLASAETSTSTPGNISLTASDPLGVTWTTNTLVLIAGTCTFDTPNPAFATIAVAPLPDGGIADTSSSGLMTQAGLGLGAAGLLVVGGTVIAGRRRQRA